MPVPARRKLGQLLTDAGLLTPEQLADAIQAAADSGMRLGEYLCARGRIREDQLVELLSRQLRLGRYDPEAYPIDMALG